MMSWARESASAPSSVSDATDGLLKTRVLIGTPTRGREVSDNHRRCVDELRIRLREQVLPLNDMLGDPADEQLVRPTLVENHETGWSGILAAPHDICRTRDRMLRFFLEHTQADWLLFWDDDVWGKDPHITLASMLTVATACDAHVVGALYPRKVRDEQRIIEAVKAGKTDPLRHGFTLADMRMWKRTDHNPNSPHKWLIPVNGLGFGFCLISRMAVTALTERYRAELKWADKILGGDTVGLTHMVLDGHDSFSEDYSFCIRAAAGGFPIFAYVGPGSPLIHEGMDSFEASNECFAALRVP